MKKDNIKAWLKAAGIRAVRTMAQTAIATISTTAAATMGAVDWAVVLSTSVLAGILTLLTCVAGLPEVEQKK